MIALVTALILLVGYFLVRPGLLEHEYLNALNARSAAATTGLERFESEKSIEGRDFQKFRETLEKEFGPADYFAVFDKKNVPVYRHTLDRESELFYSLTQEIQSGKVSTGMSPLVRFYNQKKYYVHLNNFRDGSMALSYAFRLSRKDIIRIALELTLIILLSVAAGALVHIALYRSGKIAPTAEHRVIKVGARKEAAAPGDDRKAGEMSAQAAESLKNYVLELFSAIAAGHSPDSISLYIMDRESTRMAKTFEMKGQSFIKIDTPDLDVIDVRNDIGTELKKASTLVLSNGNRLLLPILFRNSLLGAVNLVRGVPFKGMEIADIKSSFGNIAQHLSEYIFCHDVVTDAESGLYSNFYFKLKYDEAVKRRAKGGDHFAAMSVQLFRENAPAREPFLAIVRGLSKKIAERLGEDDIATLHGDTVSVLLPGAEKERAVEAAEELLAYLSKLTVKTEKGRVDLAPCIGLSSSDMLGAGTDPMAAARQNLDYALLSGESRVEYSNIRSM